MSSRSLIDSVKLTNEQQSQPQVYVLVAAGLIHVMDNNKITYVMEDSKKINAMKQLMAYISCVCTPPAPSPL